MKKLLLIALLAAAVLSACAGPEPVMIAATATPEPSSTSVPTPIPTHTPLVYGEGCLKSDVDTWFEDFVPRLFEAGEDVQTGLTLTAGQPQSWGELASRADARLLAQLNSSPAQCLERLNDLANEHFELQLITYSAARDGEGQRVIEFSEKAEAKLFEIAEEIRRLEDTYGMTY